MNVPRNALVFCPRPLFSSSGLQAGDSEEIYFTGRFSGLPSFRLQPSLKPLAKAALGSPLKGAGDHRLLPETQA